MHIPLLFLALLIPLATPHPRRQLNYCTGDKSKVGYCETLTYIDRTASTKRSPPTTQECQDTCRLGIFGEAGDWIVTFEDSQPSTYRQNMLGWPCGFSIARAPGQPQNYSFSMNNQDIGDIVDEVLTRFVPLHNGTVAAEGLVQCEGWNATWFVERLH
ncbi:hypothetical protein T440DRAFT_468741 [Plenodomus tracheiphilus IPT5]|uniref:Ecp2 effector protein-like domain-containing protein n=1 Tax=Plenodomus tracheiphilus IPT5 TaxID=1408161 RepID=A0A6A7B6P3_9PLEO|nr:hypothetical protein T440DRAFT_468741 [Plenodomus tracheiphilus IPT5]